MILHVYVRKRVTNGASLLRTVTTRAERRGWKVLDFSEPKELEEGSPYAAAERRNETYPNTRSAAGQGRAAARGSTTASAGGRLMDFWRFSEALVFKFAEAVAQARAGPEASWRAYQGGDESKPETAPERPKDRGPECARALPVSAG
jgi:hypothetical protein